MAKSGLCLIEMVHIICFEMGVIIMIDERVIIDKLELMKERSKSIGDHVYMSGKQFRYVIDTLIEFINKKVV